MISVMDYGAFVDVGVKKDGLLRNDAFGECQRLAAGDEVTVLIASVDIERQKIEAQFASSGVTAHVSPSRACGCHAINSGEGGDGGDGADGGGGGTSCGGTRKGRGVSAESHRGNRGDDGAGCL